MIENFKEEFICGIKFQTIADVIIDINRFDDLSVLKDGSIIWCKTDFIPELFDKIKNNDNKYILISHCSDYEINEFKFINKPKCIYKWYAQNVNYKHKDLVPLPIGIENDKGCNRGQNTDFEFIKDYIKPLSISNKIINKIYCNFNPITNINRYDVIKILTENGNGIFDRKNTYKEYCEEVKRFLFVASPKGNGIDCHRTWETLYLGSIPIVERHFMYDTFKDLPIIQIDDWKYIDEFTITETIEK